MKGLLIKIGICFISCFTVINCSAQEQFINPSGYNYPVRVACVRASTTYGGNIPNFPLNAFPPQLQRILGDNWEVRNFGVNSTGILKRGDSPYWNTSAFKTAKDFQPDVVIFNLGVNDVKPQNWKYKKDFFADYKEMISIFKNLPSHPKIYLCREIPVFQDHWGITAKAVNDELYPMKKKLAKEMHLPMIDLYTPLINDAALFGDGIHPNAAGAAIIAQTIAKALTGKDASAVDAIYPGKESQWHGFDRYDFQYNLLEARLIIPHRFAKGDPWVWRACFPDWHTDMDSILLNNGFAVFFLNTNDMFGSPEAMNDWNELYGYLTSTYHFNKKIALEGVSRGALYVYNFAKDYPERVSCLYAEAPVCDIKSWPGGKEKSPGDAGEWQKLLNALHLSEEQAIAYKANPIDSLEKLAKYKIPVWHSIGLNDSLAPPEENTFILARRYMELGGPVTVYPNTKGATGLHGHHFSIDDPAAGANFIMYNYYKQ